MFLFLKNLKPLHWALIGGAVILITTLAFFYNRYTSSLVQHGADTAVIGAYKAQAEHKEQSSLITDQTVTEFVKNQTTAKEEQAQSRTEVIDEYLKQPHAPVLVDSPKSTTGKPSPTQTAHETPTLQSTDAVGTSDAALLQLANRMYERYCHAGGTDPNCNTVNTAH